MCRTSTLRAACEYLLRFVLGAKVLPLMAPPRNPELLKIFGRIRTGTPLTDSIRCTAPGAERRDQSLHSFSVSHRQHALSGRPVLPR
mgnify:FL=1